MQIEHFAMLFFAALALWLGRKSLLASVSIVWSQVPFWVGSSVYFITGGPAYWFNLGTDLLCAAGFLLLAHMFGGAWLAWCCALFIVASIIDISALTLGLQFYVELHEILHYLCLIAIVSQRYVDRFSYFIRRRLFGGVDGSAVR